MAKSTFNHCAITDNTFPFSIFIYTAISVGQSAENRLRKNTAVEANKNRNLQQMFKCLEKTLLALVLVLIEGGCDLRGDIPILMCIQNYWYLQLFSKNGNI